jgi:hypothetical protein
MNPDSGHLFFQDSATRHRPDAGSFADPLRHHAEVRAASNQNLFEETDEVHRPQVRSFFTRQISAKVDDGISNQLAGPVIGNVAAAVDLVHLNATAGQEQLTSEDVRAMRVAAERYYRGMFEEEQRVVNLVSLSRSDDLLLDGETLRIGDATEMEEVHQHEAIAPLPPVSRVRRRIWTKVISNQHFTTGSSM